MSEGKRPGGLTALAVINFIFCGFGLLGIISLVAFFAIFTSPVLVPEMQVVKDAFDQAGLGMGILILTTVIGLISYALLLISGIGYLMQKKFLGRTVGNIYAIISILSSLIGALWLPVAAGGGFTLVTILGLIYPVLTVFLINRTFKNDLVN